MAARSVTRIILFSSLYIIPLVFGSQCECEGQHEMAMSIMLNTRKIAELEEANNKMNEKIISLQKLDSSTFGGWKVCA